MIARAEREFVAEEREFVAEEREFVAEEREFVVIRSRDRYEQARTGQTPIAYDPERIGVSRVLALTRAPG